MTRYRLTGAADEDMVLVFIQGCDLFGRRQADRYFDGLHDCFQRLALNPGTARLRTEFNPPLRVAAYKAHVVIYEVDDDGVTILRVRHGREDWPADPLGGAVEGDVEP